MASNANRRKFLKAGVTGAIIGLAGCQGGTSDEGGDGEGGDGGDGDSGGEDTPTATFVEPEEDVEYEELPEMTWLAQSRSQNPQNYEWGQLVKQQLERLGFQIKWDVVESGTWADRLFAREWDFTHLAWSGSPERIYPYYNLFFSFHSQFAEVGEGGYQLWGHPNYDEAVENFIAATDREESKKWAWKCQAIIGQNPSVGFLNHPAALVAHQEQNWTNWNEMFGTFAYKNFNTLRELEPVSDGGDVVYATTREYDNFPNFFSITGPDMLMGLGFIYDSLTYVDYGGEPYGMAAEDWEWEDNTTLHVTLRDGLEWHDGEPFTTEDVKFTYDWLNGDQEVPYLGSDLAPYENSEVLSDTEIRFNLNQPFSGFPQISMFRPKIMPRHIWEGAPEEHNVEHASQLQTPQQVPLIGSGPFKFVDYERNNQYIVEKNDNHYWADEFEMDRFIKTVYGNQSSLIGDLVDGGIDFAQFLQAEHWSRANDSANANAVANGNLYTTGVWFLNTEDPFTDVLVKRAINHALDREAALNFVFNGQGQTAKGPIAPANEFYYNPHSAEYSTDLSRARELLAESGLRWNDDGRLMMPTDWEPSIEYAEPDQEEWHPDHVPEW